MARSAVHEECQQQNDWQRNSDQPKQCTFSKAHGVIRCGDNRDRCELFQRWTRSNRDVVGLLR
jgi:hypothetical protein